ncbi:MAG: hypothetical protein AAGK14_15840 [Verrucomicrobiota bacterium]
MSKQSFLQIAQALNQANVRYIVVGGYAVIAHGHLRYTRDIDLVIRLEEANLKRAFEALMSIGYNMRVPITPQEFAHTETREELIREKNMVVLNLWSDQHPTLPVDIFIREPFDFEEEYRCALQEEMPTGTKVRFARVPTLIKMKEGTGRAKDLDDLEFLRQFEST